mmetsp:Transcript_15436/g.39723  ORF Transcript_15436/g.39723 Transcript_15436/m.39723 type:complete len:155 (+) Transcript_15436:218-682(+)
MGGVRLRRMGGMLHRVKKMMKSGIFEQPEWLQAMEKVPPAPLPKAKTPAKLRFPETPLLMSYIRQHPEVKNIPVELDGPEPFIGRRFVWRQMEVMEERGISAKDAADVVEEEFSKLEQDGGMGKPAVSRLSVVQQVQKEEARELAAAMSRIHKA